MKFIEPMLADKKLIDFARVVPLCEDDLYGEQQKIDGDRLLIHVEDGDVRAMSRNGLPLAGVKADILGQFKGMKGRWVFDGEYFERRYLIFDLVEGAGRSFTDEPLWRRYKTLQTFFEQWNPHHVSLLPLHTSHAAKVELAQFVIAERCEGTIFKLLESPYRVGVRSDDWLKWKLWYDIDCHVTELRRDGKSNMVLTVYRDGKPVEIGEVTANAGDGRHVKVDDVVTVKYGYLSAAGRLVQPTKPRLHMHGDKAPTDCSWYDLVHQGLAVMGEATSQV